MKELSTGVVTRVSTDSLGNQANAGLHINYTFSPDGTKILFDSDASNLVAGDTNAAQDVFVKDLVTGIITRVSTDHLGNQVNGGGGDAVLSPDGKKLAFVSHASNLVAGDTNNATDIFVKDLITGAVIRIPTDGLGIEPNMDSYSPVFSPDGTRLAFASSASNLVAGDTGYQDIFVVTLSEDGQNLVGTPGADTLTGGLGNDTLSGLASADLLIGGAGDDFYILSDNLDTVVEAANGGIDTIQAENISITIGANIENLLMTGAGSRNGAGNARANVITGNSGDNTLWGNAGADSISAGEGNDSLLGGSENDTLDGGNGNDTLDGGSGADSLNGGAGDDLYLLSANGDSITEDVGGGTDMVQAHNISLTLAANVEHLVMTGTAHRNGAGNALDNSIVGNTGNNALWGKDGLDTLSGGQGNDTLDGGNGEDFITGGTGQDSLLGGAGADALLGEEGNDTLNGGAGDDAIFGGSEDDLLIAGGAGGGFNLLGGEAGNDTLVGGSGADVFQFFSTGSNPEGTEHEWVQNFRQSGNDILELRWNAQNVDEYTTSSEIIGANTVVTFSSATETDFIVTLENFTGFDAFTQVHYELNNLS
jgi:Ca2+-binding RTX toxin-like protein